MIKVLRRIDVLLLCLIAIIAIAVSILDFFHKLPPNSVEPPIITLVFLAMLALHIIVSHFGHEDFQAKTAFSLEQISRAIVLGEFRSFQDSVELEHYLAERILKATKSVCDLTWKAKISEQFATGHRQISHQQLDNCVARASKNISYREIFVFSDVRRVNKMNRRLAENIDGYSCRYYKDESRIPRLQFVIVDDEEVVFFAISPYSQLCAVRSVELCKVFKPYYDELWSAATPIKDSAVVHHDEVARIRKLALDVK